MYRRRDFEYLMNNEFGNLEKAKSNMNQRIDIQLKLHGKI